MSNVTDLHSRNVSELLECQLTEDEQRERGRQLADAVQAVDVCDEQQKTERDRMKKEREALTSEVNRLADIVGMGKEERSVTVRIDYDDARGLVHKTRLDTGELIGTRSMTEDEKQRALPFASRKVN